MNKKYIITESQLTEAGLLGFENGSPVLLYPQGVCSTIFEVPAKPDEVDEWGGGFDSAITLGNNLCVRISDDYNNDDETNEAHAANKCAKEIRKYLGDRSYKPEVIPTPPPSPLGIDVEDLLDKLKYLDHVLSDEGFESESEVRKIVTQTINYVTEAGYAATLPQSSTGGLPKLDQPILDEDDVKGIIESSTEEEKDLWTEVISEIEINDFISTKYEDVINNLRSKIKISRR